MNFFEALFANMMTEKYCSFFRGIQTAVSFAHRTRFIVDQSIMIGLEFTGYFGIFIFGHGHTQIFGGIGIFVSQGRHRWSTLGCSLT